MINDKVRVQFSFQHIGTENIPIYQVISVDEDGNARIKVAGGVKPGTVGTINDQPVRVLKTKLVGQDKIHALGGNDTVLLYPIYFDLYKQVGWLPTEHFQILGQ